MLKTLFIIFNFFASSIICAHAAQELPLDKIKLPPGFKIEVYADNVPNARSLAVGDKGTVFVGSRAAGNVYALVDGKKENKADKVYLIGEGLNSPVGVAFHDGALYVAEIHRVIRYDNIEENLESSPQPVTVNDQFPQEGHHGWKFIRFGPDNKLYVPVGAACNVCETVDPYGTLLRMDPDGKNLEVYARGIRNTVGFDWDPATKELWFTDNGRDELGDNIPPDELNHAPKDGLNFGFPYCHGKNVQDPQFGFENACQNFVPAVQELGPHVASLGMRFYTGKMFPEDYRDQIFIAEHGSWNRSKKIGYRISLVRLKDNQPISYEVFAEGWLQAENAWGRPVDVMVMPDGALLVSDDHAGTVYRISYQKPAP